LSRIESRGFSYALLKSIEIARVVRSIDVSAFIDFKFYSISIEAGHDQFVIDNDFLIEIVDQRLIRIFSRSSHFEIMHTFEILGSSCFSGCNLLSFISFQSNPQFKRIEAAALNRLNH
jgi:hypothetical protein